MVKIFKLKREPFEMKVLCSHTTARFWQTKHSPIKWVSVANAIIWFTTVSKLFQPLVEALVLRCKTVNISLYLEFYLEDVGDECATTNENNSKDILVLPSRQVPRSQDLFSYRLCKSRGLQLQDDTAVASGLIPPSAKIDSPTLSYLTKCALK